jgi:tetratricopeptide (TPR) repeat protein
LAELQFDLKNAKKAIPLLKKAVVIHPKDARAYRYLGLFNRDYFVSKKTALDHLRKYAKLAPNDHNAYHYLAVAHWRLGGKKNPSAYIKAAENMKIFTDLSGNRPYGYKRIGYFYYKGRNYREAEKWFKKALEIDDTNEYALKMIKKIKRK